MSPELAVGGRTVKVTNLDKVLYPATGTTKADVLGYYAAVTAVIVPHLRGRPLTRKRWPDGVAAEPFFEKNSPRGMPAWIDRVTIQHGSRDITYPLVDEPATMVWLAQAGALELHVPQWRVDDAGERLPPDRLVVDLDPGAPAGLAECAEVALAARDLLADIGLTAHPVTSGSKGMQLYARLPPGWDHGAPSTLAKELAAGLERAMPELATSTMTKAVRPGKVFVDWSQNNPAKTTISPYSLRGRDHPTVASPRTWAEVEARDLVQVPYTEQLARLAADGDLVAALVPDPHR